MIVLVQRSNQLSYATEFVLRRYDLARAKQSVNDKYTNERQVSWPASYSDIL